MPLAQEGAQASILTNYGGLPSPMTSCYACGLASTSGILSYHGIERFVSQELDGSGYSRQQLWYNATINTTTNTLTLSGGGVSPGFASAGTPIVLAGTTPPAPLNFGEIYYITGSNGVTAQVAATPGGTAIDITSAGSGITAMLGGFWDNEGGGYVSTSRTVRFSASTAALSLAGVFLIRGGVSFSPVSATASSATGTITTTSAHGVTTGMAVTVSGVVPDPIVVGGKYWASAPTTTTLKLHPSKLDAISNTSAIGLTTNGGSFKVHNCDGVVSAYDLFTTPITIAAGTYRDIAINLRGR